MKRILSASGSVITGDAIARSVVRYATSLAKVGSADTITIPVVKGDRHETVEMLIGPSSQLILEDAGADPAAAFSDRSFQEEIEHRRDLVENPPVIMPRGRPFGPPSLIDEF